MAIKQNRYVFRQKRQRENTVFASGSNISHSSLMVLTARFQCTVNIFVHTHTRPKHFILFVFFLFTQTKTTISNKTKIPKTPLQMTKTGQTKRSNGRKGLNMYKTKDFISFIWNLCIVKDSREKEKERSNNTSTSKNAMIERQSKRERTTHNKLAELKTW